MDEAIRPRIGVPMGDPAGIGPEIALLAALDPGVAEAADVVLVGSRRVAAAAGRILRQAGRLEGVGDDDLERVLSGLAEVPGADVDPVPYGRIDAACGRAAYACIRASSELALAGRIDAVATTPIHKESIRAAGVPFIGHTEMYGALSGTPDPVTLFQTGRLRILFLTRHLSLQDACRAIAEDRVFRGIVDGIGALSSLGLSRDTDAGGRESCRALLAVAGLNPHNGEHGLFGDEEGRFIEPAIRRAREEGYDVTGPVPADSVFAQALHGRYGAVLSLYHDQGHIAAKTLDFERTISLTLGMPFLRTSVDHGTAFDLAGQGAASATSMKEAVRLAAAYAPRYRAPNPALAGETKRGDAT